MGGTGFHEHFTLLTDPDSIIFNSDVSTIRYLTS